MTAVVEIDPIAPSTGTGAEASARRLPSKFWRLWSASVVSNLGDGLALVAFPIAAALLTRNPLLVAGVTFMQRLPWLLFALPAGALADRVNRAAAMATADASRGVVLCAVAVAAHLDVLAVAHLYLAAFAIGSLETVFAAAGMAAIPALVPVRHLDRANGLLYANETTGAELVGPALGGVAVAAAVAIPFALDGASFLISAFLLLALRRWTPAPEHEVSARLRDDVRVGLHFFRRQRLLRLVAGLVSALAFFQSMVMAILVLYATSELGLGAGGYGVFLAVGAIGSVIGGIMAGRIRERIGTAATLTGAAAVAAVGYLAVAGADTATFAAAAFGIEALAVSCGNVATLSLRQALVPDHLRGRVSNVFRLCIFAGIPLGALAGGALASLGGIRTPIVVAGAAQLLLAVAIAGRLRTEVRAEERRIGEVLDLRDEPALAPA